MENNCEPLGTIKNRLLRIAWWTLQNALLTFAHGEGEGWEHVGHKIQKQNLQGQEWQGSARQVHVGVILVQYEGAQGAGPRARSKKDAQTLAQKLADEARSDFRAAVQHGDSGSSDDIGHIQRGVLDGPIESALFALPVGGVSDVIDTPRGFWIAKRLE